ncbi:hypothetical protein [Amycolatopsis sp.]|uniref:hypothetical protein n=1 Tax=Amycolatopsis sp. TaxID=37632 RepID=UPI002BB5F245|nr:hypothetical protein [Amycolatopsis sp.]HVV12063.1 hypothetical protein [Amycolatopsis sp.]
MICEYGMETYRFTCHHCDHTWTIEYQVRYATDSEGSPWTFHYREGSPAASPVAGTIVCDHCRHTHVGAHLDARRYLPARQPDIEPSTPN